MNSLKLVVAIAALITLSATQSFATFTVINKAPVAAEIYIVGIAYEYMNPKSKGNLAIDETGNPDPEGANRLIQPGQQIDFAFEGVRGNLPIKDLMVRFPPETLFKKAKQAAKAPKKIDQVITLTQVNGAASISFEE